MTTPAETPAEHADTPQETPAWVKQYTAAKDKLPASISSRLPDEDTARAGVNVAAQHLGQSKVKLDELSTASKIKYGELRRTGSQRAGELQTFTKEAWKTRGPESLATQAWSVTNETQVALNISLNQVGPLYFGVIKPGEIFERRVPNLPFFLEIRPFTANSEYSTWSASWPILVVTGPVVAAASLVAIPFVALAAGGSALASLTGIGSSIAAGATAAVETATGTAASAAALAAKANWIPGAKQVKTRLANAAREAVGEHISKDKVQEHVVRYIQTRAGVGAASLVGGEELQRLEAKEDDDRRKIARKEGKVEEVEVTGYDVEKVLQCKTGSSKVDTALAKAFKRLSLKSGLKEFKTEENPVLRVVGGPELETRTPPSSFLHPHPAPKNFLVFYPFVILHAPPGVIAEPVPLSETAPTADEKRVMDEAKVVEKWETAEKVKEKQPAKGEGKEAFEKTVEEVEKEETPNVATAEEGKGKTAEGAVGGEKKKGWLW